MDMNNLWEALKSSSQHQHTDECRTTSKSPQDLRTLQKVKRMTELSKDIEGTLWDKHAMLLSTHGTLSEHWLARWPDKAPHLAYLKACHEASGIIVLCKDPALVMETWRNVKKPKECEATTIGEAAEGLLKSVAMERYWALGLMEEEQKKK